LKKRSDLLKVIGAPRLRYRQLAGLLLMLCPLWGNAIAVADEDAERLKSVKAAFILNVARFVTWPPEVFEKEDTPYTLCLYRTNSLGSAIESIRGKRVSTRHLRVSTINKLEESLDCTILFIPLMEAPHFKAEVQSTFQRPLLTITDLTAKDAITGVSHKGVMVSMVREKARIGLEVDLQQTRNAGLQVSSQLLKLVRIVRYEGD